MRYPRRDRRSGFELGPGEEAWQRRRQERLARLRRPNRSGGGANPRSWWNWLPFGSLGENSSSEIGDGYDGGGFDAGAGSDSNC